MSDTTTGLRRKISSAGDLRSVVRTMKALAAANIGQYETTVRAVADYDRTVALGLGVCLRDRGPATWMADDDTRSHARAIDAVVFGSDQGLVGQFDEVVADYALETIAGWPGAPRLWTVGEQVHARLLAAGLRPTGHFAVPNAVNGIVPLVGQILVEYEARRSRQGSGGLHLFYNRPAPAAAYVPAGVRLLPLDENWRRGAAAFPWQAGHLPEILGNGTATLRALIREYLFVSLFQACAESLASENASRLTAMERADRNIDDLLDTLHRSFHRVRQSRIDEELFDVMAGFEALVEPR